MLRLQANDLIDSRLEANYYYHSKLKYWTIEHAHDFYEMFLITEGHVVHVVNGVTQRLSAGAFVFLRPDDLHSFEKLNGIEVEMLNVNYRKEMAEALLTYLGDRHPLTVEMRESALPTAALLDTAEIAYVKKQYESVMALRPDAWEERRSADRALLAEWVTRYFGGTRQTEQDKSIGWLFRLCQEMKVGQRFTGGIQELYKRSPVGKEHLSRAMRKQLGVTPTEWLNELKLNYAANLLKSSDDGISEIAMEAGFSNISHFHALFRSRFVMSPGAYRKQYSDSQWKRFIER